jgi:CPA1 family monovalent cation:H+ antiporter
MAASLAGVRGAITLAGIMTLPLVMGDGTPFPARDLALFLASTVILLSLVMASVGLPRLLQGLELPDEPVTGLEEERARREAALAAIAAVEKAERLVRQNVDAAISARAAAQVIALYRRRLEQSDGPEAGLPREAEDAERTLRVAGLNAERERIFSLARDGRISDATSRKLVREIDLTESRYRSA